MQIVEPQPPAYSLDTLFAFEYEFNRKLPSSSLQQNSLIFNWLLIWISIGSGRHPASSRVP
eukprot:7875632-Pyramimonas_sp.AAC.1